MVGTLSAQPCIRLVSGNATRYHKTLTISTSRRTFQTSSLLGRSANSPGQVSVGTFENVFLTAGSAFMAFVDPRRGDMVAALGETTAGFALPRLRDMMLDSPEGRRILKNRPRVNSKTLDLQTLRALPDGTFGREYTRWLQVCNINPDSREPVHYTDDLELAYVMQRYRETHDFCHALFALRVSALPELALKAFEFANLGLPMTALALGASVKMKEAQRNRLWHEFIPWGIRCGGSARCFLTVYWEERWEQDVQDIKKELRVWNPPGGLSIHSP